jgi:hypothetical protein
MTRRRALWLASLGGAAFSVACFLIRLAVAGGGTIDLVLSAAIDRLTGAEGTLHSMTYGALLAAIYGAGGASLSGLACLMTKPSARSALLCSALGGAVAAIVQILLGRPVQFG